MNWRRFICWLRGGHMRGYTERAGDDMLVRCSRCDKVMKKTRVRFPPYYGIFLLAALHGSGCTTASGYSILYTREREARPDGTVFTREGPDRRALGAILGSVTSMITGKPWGVLAGASVELGESASKLVSVPADMLTTRTR